MFSWLTRTKSEYQLCVQVASRASSNRIIGEHNGALKIALTSAPVDGKANAALVTFLSKKLNLPKKSIEIVCGHTAKRKKLRILTTNNIEDLLS